MHEPIPLDERVASLEIEVATLKRQVAAAPTEQNWLDGMTGSMKDFSEFKEVLRMGAEWRKAQEQP